MVSLALPQQNNTLPLAPSSSYNARPPLSSHASHSSHGSMEDGPTTHYRRMRAEQLQQAAEKEAARLARRQQRAREKAAERQLLAAPAVGLGRSASNRSGREKIEAQRAVARLEQAKHRRNQASQSSQATTASSVGSVGNRLTRSSGYSSLFGLGADLSRSNTSASSASSSSVVSTHPSRSISRLPDLIHNRNESQSSIASSSLASFGTHSANSSISWSQGGGGAPGAGWSSRPPQGLFSLADLAEGAMEDLDPYGSRVGSDDVDEEEEAVERIRIVSPLRRTGTLGKAGKGKGAQPTMRMSDVLDEILEMERGFIVGHGVAQSPRRPTSPIRQGGLLPSVDLASPPRAMDISPPRPRYARDSRGSLTPRLATRVAAAHPQRFDAPLLSLGQLRTPATTSGGGHQRKRSLADAISPSSPLAPFSVDRSSKRRSSSFSAYDRPVSSSFFSHGRTRSSDLGGYQSRLSPAALLEESSPYASDKGSAPKRRKASIATSPDHLFARPRTLNYSPSERSNSCYSHASSSRRPPGGGSSSISSIPEESFSPSSPARSLLRVVNASPRAARSSFRGSTSSQGTFTFPLSGGGMASSSSQQSLPILLDQSPPLPSTPSLLAEKPIFGGGGPAARFPLMGEDGTLHPVAPLLSNEFPSSPGKGGEERVGERTGERLWSAFSGAATSSPTASPARKWGWKW